jgi:hypothetical protein
MDTNFFPTKRRQWEKFCERQRNDGTIEYYYQGSACNLLQSSIDLPLDFEPQLPEENEVAASKRVIGRLCENMPRLFDLVVADALYMEAPFINFCLQRKKDVVIVLKNNYSSLIREADVLRGDVEPLCWKYKDRSVTAWDIEGFNEVGVNKPLRVLYVEQRDSNGELISKCYWATTLTKLQITARGLFETGLSRWQIENEIFNVMDTHWGLDHCYCHNPRAIVNFILMLFLTFTLLQCFYKRNLKPQQREIINTFIGLGNLLYAELAEFIAACFTVAMAIPPP